MLVTGGSTSSTTAEIGGPGVVYVEGPDIKNLRVDNRCQQPKVTYYLYLGCNWTVIIELVWAIIEQALVIFALADLVTGQDYVLFGLMHYVPVNSYVHLGTASLCKSMGIGRIKFMTPGFAVRHVTDCAK